MQKEVAKLDPADGPPIRLPAPPVAPPRAALGTGAGGARHRRGRATPIPAPEPRRKPQFVPLMQVVPAGTSSTLSSSPSRR
jgi:hypothetical protein